MAKIRLELSSYLGDLIQEAALLTNSTPRQALDRLLIAIELHAKHGELDIGIEWQKAARVLAERARASKEDEPQTYPDVDLSLLEHGKSRSGFVGVYFANGKFRAIVPDPAQGMGSKTLPGRDTALAAAVDRYRWHQTYGLPYGNLGWHIERYREQHPEKSIDDALLWAHDLVSSGTFGLKKPFTLVQVEATIRARRKQLGLPTDVIPDPLPEAATPAKVICVECKDEIIEGEPFVPHSSGPSAWAHAGCV